MGQTTGHETDAAEDRAVRGYLETISGRAWGISLGVLFGLVLFVATNILVWRAGDNVGAHLGLLSNYFPYYEVTFVGSLVGFGYAFVIGYVTGRVICAVYNRAARV